MEQNIMEQNVLIQISEYELTLLKKHFFNALAEHQMFNNIDAKMFKNFMLEVLIDNKRVKRIDDE